MHIASGWQNPSHEKCVGVASHYLDFFSVSVFKVLLDNGVHRLLQQLFIQLRHHRGVHCVTLFRETDTNRL